MKKFLSVLTLPFFISTCALADDPVCSSSERHWATDSRFFDTGISSRDGIIATNFFDLETIKIDKKKKIIKVWIIREKSEKERSYMSKEFNGFSNYGWDKMLWTIDYANMRLNKNPLHFMNCDGSVIDTLPNSKEWENISPSSIDEAVIKEIMQKYNLK